MKMFADYKVAEARARDTGEPLWDTHQLLERYAVGWLTIEMEEDPDNDWEEIEVRE